jgi:hypothetical protein
MSEATTTTNPNNLELNTGDQFIIGLDISASMQTPDCPGGLKRYDYTLETLRMFVAEANKWDPDGVSFYPFGAKVHAYRDLQPADIESKLAKPVFEGMTMTHLAINEAWKEHVEKKNEQTFLMIFTDGEPSDPQAVEQAIVDITKKVKDEKEFRIEILTMGNRSDSLNKWLTDLDDNLVSKKGAKYDIVGIKKLEEVDFNAAVMNALEG